MGLPCPCPTLQLNIFSPCPWTKCFGDAAEELQENDAGDWQRSGMVVVVVDVVVVDVVLVVVVVEVVEVVEVVASNVVDAVVAPSRHLHSGRALGMVFFYVFLLVS